LIATWNAWGLLRGCLAALRAHADPTIEIVVIDNASSDDTATNVREEFPDVRMIVNPTNVGHTRAVNRGFDLTESKYILVLDADTDVQAGAIDRLVEFMEERTDVAVAAPRLYDTDGSVQPTARNFPGVMNGLFGRHSLLTRLFPNNPFSARYLRRDKLHATEPFQVEQVTAACMMIRRSVLASAGRWDEGYRGYFVDTDWCMRLKAAGEKVFCVPRAGATHHESNEPRKKVSLGRIWMFHLGAYRLYRTHSTWGALDPRALIALTALCARASLLTVRNALRSAAPPEPAPVERARRAEPAREVFQ
jgi:GT2 family glycosyltransferase